MIATSKRRSLEPWLYCLPALFVIALVAFVPLARTAYFAFTDARLGFADSARWIGFTNFLVLATDPDWWLSVRNTMLFAALSVTLEVFFGLLLAMVLNSQIRGRGILRASVLIPWAIPTVVSARMWAWMFHDLYGVINEVLLSLHFIDSPLAWLASPGLSLVAMVAVDVWKTTPFAALLLLAGLQSIPRSIYEAAKVDGASQLSTFFSLTLPLMRPAIAVTVIFRMLDALRIFDLPFVLTSNNRESMVMSMFARQQLIDFQDVGYGSAASLLIFCVIAVLSIAYLSMNRKSVWGEA